MIAKWGYRWKVSEAVSSRSATRSIIIDVAAQLLQEHGPLAVTTRGVADRAGVQAPTIYRLFGDKDGLLDAVAEHVMATFVSAKAEHCRRRQQRLTSIRSRTCVRVGKPRSISAWPTRLFSVFSANRAACSTRPPPERASGCWSLGFAPTRGHRAGLRLGERRAVRPHPSGGNRGHPDAALGNPARATRPRTRRRTCTTPFSSSSSPTRPERTGWRHHGHDRCLSRHRPQPRHAQRGRAPASTPMARPRHRDPLSPNQLSTALHWQRS